MHRKGKRSHKILFAFVLLLAIIFELPVILFSHRHSDESGPFGYSHVEELPGPNELKKADMPSHYVISVPFTSQAPLYNWDSLHEDACEEASLLMLYYWHENKAFGTADEVDSEIKAIISYEEGINLGTSITLGQLATVANQYFNLKTTVQDISSPQDIKTMISENRPVIVGAAGKVLPNPNFRNGGPNYHMLLIKGYDSNGFITNDPGTRNGEDYYYTNDQLYDAIHDWNSDNILLGYKRMLYISN